MTTAFVLGGGGVHGAAEVGMLRALTAADIRPDLIVGTSIGAINGAVLAADPDAAVARLTALWTRADDGNPFEATILERAATVARSWTHLHGSHRLQRLLLEALHPVRSFEELAVPFTCVAASMSRRPFSDTSSRGASRRFLAMMASLNSGGPVRQILTLLMTAPLAVNLFWMSPFWTPNRKGHDERRHRIGRRPGHGG
jgi:predicted acylesterase/phospholipase RssA